MKKSDAKAPPKNSYTPKMESCREAAMGVPGYIPCGKPATYVVENRGEVNPMCPACADHNVRNRGARYMLKDEDVKIGPPAPVSLIVADVEDDDSGPTAQQLSIITTNVSRALKLQEFIIPEREAELAKLKEEFKTIVEVTLPNAMTDAKMGGYTYSDRNDGKWQTELVNDIKASVSKENFSKFKDFLVETKQDDLIKRKITIKFGRDQVKLAMKFIADLAKRKVDLHPVVDEEVNWQTLNSWVREKRANAIDSQLDPDQAVPPMVSLFKIRFAKFTKQEEKKGITRGGK